MKGFNFRFQSILNIKEMEERRLQEEYALLKRVHNETVNTLHSLEDHRKDKIYEMQNNENEGYVDLNQAMLYRNYLSHLKREITTCQREEERCREEMTAGFQRMVEKTKERKIFEKLKEKQKAGFVSEQLRTMQNELDDLAQGRFNHQKKSVNLEAK